MRAIIFLKDFVVGDVNQINDSYYSIVLDKYDGSDVLSISFATKEVFDFAYLNKQLEFEECRTIEGLKLKNSEHVECKVVKTEKLDDKILLIGQILYNGKRKSL